MKLQDAYVSEAGIYAGNWKMIGYVMQNSNNFDFADGLEGNETTKLEGLSKTKGWSATNKAKLNDCPQGENWMISIKEGADAANGSPIQYFAEYKTENEENCKPLTANFSKLSNGSDDN